MYLINNIIKVLFKVSKRFSLLVFLQNLLSSIDSRLFEVYFLETPQGTVHCQMT